MTFEGGKGSKGKTHSGSSGGHLAKSGSSGGPLAKGGSSSGPHAKGGQMDLGEDTSSESAASSSSHHTSMPDLVVSDDSGEAPEPALLPMEAVWPASKDVASNRNFPTDDAKTKAANSAEAASAEAAAVAEGWILCKVDGMDQTKFVMPRPKSCPNQAKLTWATLTLAKGGKGKGRDVVAVEMFAGSGNLSRALRKQKVDMDGACKGKGLDSPN